MDDGDVTGINMPPVFDMPAANDMDFNWQYENESADKKLMDEYYVSEDRMDLMNVTLATLENSNVKNHIVVCGIHSAIKNFIMPLRMKYLK